MHLWTKTFIRPFVYEQISGEYLLDICGLVDCLYIDQWYSDDTRGTNYLFGLRNENWGILLAEMFAKRVSFVEIDNGDDSILSTPLQLQHVIEVGQQLGIANDFVNI